MPDHWEPTTHPGHSEFGVVVCEAKDVVLRANDERVWRVGMHAAIVQSVHAQQRRFAKHLARLTARTRMGEHARATRFGLCARTNAASSTSACILLTMFVNPPVCPQRAPTMPPQQVIECGRLHGHFPASTELTAIEARGGAPERPALELNEVAAVDLGGGRVVREHLVVELRQACTRSIRQAATTVPMAALGDWLSQQSGLADNVRVTEQRCRLS
jgi:hypothetical protein